MTDSNDWNELRSALRNLHRVLVERASRDYSWSREHLTPLTPGQLLQLLTTDAEFNWLRRLSELMVDIDIADDAEPPVREAFALGVRAAVEHFVLPPTSGVSADEFAQRYWPYVQEDPHVAMAHAAVKQAISTWPRPT